MEDLVLFRQLPRLTDHEGFRGVFTRQRPLVRVHYRVFEMSLRGSRRVRPATTSNFLVSTVHKMVACPGQRAALFLVCVARPTL